MLSSISNIVSVTAAVSATFAQVLGAAGIAAVVVKFLYHGYQRMYVVYLRL
jgi:NhaP-type Na+/H+ or K+/H+ antiporter